MMPTRKVKILIQSMTGDVDYKGLVNLRGEYFSLLKQNPFPTPPNNSSVIDVIRFLKRKNSSSSKVGPYEYITVFEAANRIASDLVPINGVIQLIEEGEFPDDSRITLHLGTKHRLGHGDFLIGEKHGEAFNVAESFYSSKLRDTLAKWQTGRLSYILINHEMYSQDKANKLRRSTGIKLVGVKKWDTLEV